MVLLLALGGLLGSRLVQASEWSSVADANWYNTLNDTFTIDSAVKLAGVAKLVNNGNPLEGIILEIDRDLDLSAHEWIPIGTEANPFKGTIYSADLNPKKISGLHVGSNSTYAGLIGYMDGGTIAELEFSPTGTVPTYNVTQAVYAGVAVGMMVNDSTVHNVRNSMPSSYTQSTYVGGIVGMGEGTISSSNNDQTITVNGVNTNVGGIVGQSTRTGLIVKKVANNGAITVTGAAGTIQAGGIVGYVSGPLLMHDENTPILNTAAITVNSSTTTYAGGLIGKADGKLTLSAVSSNSGALSIQSSTGTGSFLGGLIGGFGTEQPDGTGFNINFASTGALVNNGGTNVYTGGIVGRLDSTLTWGNNFTNTVSISTTGTAQLYTGGLIGKATKPITFSGIASNQGSLSVQGSTPMINPSEVYTGGLIGSTLHSALLNSSTVNAYRNSGIFSVTGGVGVYTGGITGEGAFNSPNSIASNTVDLNVTGQSKIYTGGFIGVILDGGLGKSLKNLSYAKQITVTASSSSTAGTISTGGIVGYYENISGTDAIEDVGFTGKINATGGDHVYSGGIVGNMQGGTLKNASVGKTATDYATIQADGVVGGVAGYSKGTIDTPTVKYIGLTVKTINGFAGGIAGKAQGAITGATVGDANYVNPSAPADPYAISMKLEVSVPSATDGQDRFTAGGIVGINDGVLTIGAGTSNKVSQIGLINEVGRSHYDLGAIAGALTAVATVGAAGAPILIENVKVTVNALQANVGGAVGRNASTKLSISADGMQLDVPTAGVNVGGLIGLNIATTVELDPNRKMAVKNLTINGTAANLDLGGLVGENTGKTPNGLANTIKITASGANNRIGGAVGYNTGTTTDAKVEYASLEPLGAGILAGGIVGYSEAPGGGTPLAYIKDSTLLMGSDPLMTATVANSPIGGIVGYAKTTEISNPSVQAVEPDYAMMIVNVSNVKAGGIAGLIEESFILGDGFQANLQNVAITASTNATDVYIGGIAGYNNRTKIDKISGYKVNLFANGPRPIVGGMAGYNIGTATAIISNNYMESLNIKINSGGTQAKAGGFVGLNDVRAIDPTVDPTTAVSSIQNSRFVGTVQSFANDALLGGMVAENRTLIANNSITDKNGVISWGDNSTIGGLVGWNIAGATMYYTYSNANLTVEGNHSLAGGLVGLNDGKVISSYVDIDVTGNAIGTDGNPVYLGGLAGRNTSTIEKSYTSSRVTANGPYSIVGGLVGELPTGTVANSYVAKEVSATNANSYAGGLLGRITNGHVATSYSAGHVSGSNGALAGAFIGRYDNQATDLIDTSFYLKDGEINKDLPDFAEGNHIWLNLQARLSTILKETLEDREVFPVWAATGVGPDWDFVNVWKYGSPNAQYKFPELIRTANTGGDTGSGSVNANVNWFMKDKSALFFDIKTEAELAGLAAIVNGSVPGMEPFNFALRTVRLLNPIHIQSSQWEPIGNSEANAFQGTFLANNHLIDGLSIQAAHNYSGLFGVIGNQGRVNKLYMEPIFVAGNQHTGIVAGWNKGTIDTTDIRLLDGMTVRGNVAGALLGKNTGTLTNIHVVVKDGSRVEASGNNAYVGGIIGDNYTQLAMNSYDYQVIKGSVGSSVANATVGGLIGRQTGDATNLQVEIVNKLTISASGTNNTVGGLIGRYASGHAENITLTYGGGVLTATGAGSTIGSLIGQSDAGNTLRNIKVTTASAGQHLSGNGTVGGIVGLKIGAGTTTYDAENVKVEKINLSSLSASPQATVGGVFGKLDSAAVVKPVFAAHIQAVGDNVIAGGVAGHSLNSIVNQADVDSDIAATVRTEGAVGGIAGVIEASNVNQGLDFGNFAPFYKGIYDSKVHSHAIVADGASLAGDLYVGGLVGKNSTASIYHSTATSKVEAHNAKTATAGGLVGHSNGIIVSSYARNTVSADTSVYYHVGGVAGRTDGGEFHYTNAAGGSANSVTVGTAASKSGHIPATRVGGFVGTSDRTKFTYSYASTPVTVLDTNQDNTIYVGGFAGVLGESTVGTGTIQWSYADGLVTVEGKTGVQAGGFVGLIDRYTITDSYAKANVINSGFDTRTAGFAASVERRGVIKNAYALPASLVTNGINHATRAYAGGFAGYNDGQLENVYSDVPTITMNVTGANVYKGELVGYNFRDGKIITSKYKVAGNAVGHNAGTAPGATQADLTSSLGLEDWTLDPDPVFLDQARTGEAVIMTPAQLRTAALLHNDTSLNYYRLYDRNPSVRPALNLITLGADLDLSGKRWIPFDSYSGVIDGKGYKLSGLKHVIGSESVYGFVAENTGTIKNINFVNAEITSGATVGIAAGINHPGGVLSNLTASGQVSGTTLAGGIAGQNGGTITRVTMAGTVTSSGTAAGGLTGNNLASATISESFAYSDVSATSAQATAGGIAGINSGTISDVYNAGRITATGTSWARAGGIVGYASAGSISRALNYGEAVAGVGGKLIPGQTFYGGIAGLKENAAVVSDSAFNRQMLKSNTAYYNAAGGRTTGSAAGAAGLSASALTSGTLPLQANLNGAVWQATAGYFPTLKAFAGSDHAKLSSAAIILNANDIVNRIDSAFELTKDSTIAWTGNPAEVTIGLVSGNLKGTLKTDGSTVLKATTNGLSRNILLHTEALRYDPVAVMPKLVSGNTSFSTLTSVVLATDEPSGAIYYTLDGSEPDESSTLYTGPISLTATKTVKAVTFVENKELSDVYSGTFTLQTGGGGGGGGDVPILPTPTPTPKPTPTPAPTPTPKPGTSVNIGDGSTDGDGKTPYTVPRNSKLELVTEEDEIIYYTTDGSTPTKDSPIYKGDLLITGKMTIKVITSKSDKVTTIQYETEYAKFDIKPNAADIPYISGYDETTFKPDDAISRYELIDVIAPLLDKEDVNVGNLFSDVNKGSEDLVAFFTSAGIIEGYPDGSFGGANGLTRAEFVVVMSRVLKLDIQNTGDTVLGDVQGHWAEKYINAFTAAGYVNGFPDGTFQPEAEITRAQAVVVINRIIGAVKKNVPAKYNDLTPEHWAFEDIMSVSK